MEEELKTNTDFITEETPFMTAAKVSFALFKGWEKFGFDPNYKKKMIGTISDVIYQCPHISSGYASTDAYELPYKQVTKEHYYSRNGTGSKIVDLLQKGVVHEGNLNRLEDFFKSRCRVHYVTAKENTHLTKFQRNVDYPHWKQQYEAAGITLVKWDKSPPAYTYSIEGITFNRPSDIATKFKCHKSTVVSRCNSPDEKWKNWIRKLNE